MADRDLSGRTLGEFALREQIGEGGYGVVYRAEQRLLERAVVVKVLHERRRDDVAQARFLREAQFASQLDHHHAAHIYAFGAETEDGLLWFAMELVQGTTLADWLDKRGPMPLEQFVPFFEHVAEVVHAAHERGIIHRDLKPSNIMVIEAGGRLLPKLLDFGIAKAKPEISPLVPETGSDAPLTESDEPVDALSTDQEVTARIHGRRLTRPGAAIGSRAYMAPEQWRNACGVGPEADIYSLGIVTYQALTGRLPFPGESTGEYDRQHREAAVPSLGGDFSSDLDRVIRRALAKLAEARYRSALELASALRAALRADPREQLKSLARQWQERGRSPDLLPRGQVLADVERWARRVPAGALGELECSFLADSQRLARHVRRVRRSLVVLAAAAVLAGILSWAAMQTQVAEEKARMAQQFADLSVTQAEVEAGRQALLHDESAEAQLHLSEAYRRGDHSPATAFMLSRALQPRMAEQARLTAAAGRMWSAAFSPDGSQIVTTDDVCARVWDARTSRLLFTLPHGTLPHGDTVYDARYSADGARLFTAGGDGAVRIWDATTGALVSLLKQQRRDRKPSRYSAVALSPDSKQVAAIDKTGAVVHVWDTSNGAPLAEVRNNALDFPLLAFSADGRWLATSGGGDLRVFDTRTWTQALVLTGLHARSLGFDPTGPRLASGTVGGDASIWEIPSGARIRHLREVGEPVDSLAFAPSGKLIATASRDGAEQIWDATSGALQTQFNTLRSKILSIEFDPTSKLVVAAGTSGAAAVADAALGMPVAMLEGPQGVVRVARFDPSSRRVVGASWDGTTRVWDATSPYHRWSSPPVSDDCGLEPSREPDRRFIAIGCRSRSTLVWDTARDQLLAELPAVTPVDGDFLSAIPAVSAGGDRAAIARGSTVEIYELPGGRLLRTIRHGAPVSAVAFAPTGHDLVSGATDGALLVTRDGREPIALPPSDAGIDAVAILPAGRVVAADARRRLRVYDSPDHGSMFSEVEVPARVGSLQPSPDGRRLITLQSFTGPEGPPVLWDLERYRVLARLEGHVGWVFSARFVEGGRAIVTSGGDGVARLWDGESGRFRQKYRGSTRFLADATIAPNGSIIVAGGGDGRLRFWDAASGRQLWKLQAHRSSVIGIHFEGDDIVTRGSAGDISRWTLPRPERVIDATFAK